MIFQRLFHLYPLLKDVYECRLEVLKKKTGDMLSEVRFLPESNVSNGLDNSKDLKLPLASTNAFVLFLLESKPFLPDPTPLSTGAAEEAQFNDLNGLQVLFDN